MKLLSVTVIENYFKNYRISARFSENVDGQTFSIPVKAKTNNPLRESEIASEKKALRDQRNAKIKADKKAQRKALKDARKKWMKTLTKQQKEDVREQRKLDALRKKNTQKVKTTHDVYHVEEPPEYIWVDDSIELIGKGSEAIFQGDIFSDQYTIEEFTMTMPDGSMVTITPQAPHSEEKLGLDLKINENNEIIANLPKGHIEWATYNLIWKDFSTSDVLQTEYYGNNQPLSEIHLSDPTDNQIKIADMNTTLPNRRTGGLDNIYNDIAKVYVEVSEFHVLKMNTVDKIISHPDGDNDDSSDIPTSLTAILNYKAQVASKGESQ